MELTNLEAKTKLNSILKRLNSTNNIDNVFDDGYDSCNTRQNGRFVNAIKVINNVHSELAKLDFESLSSDECDEIWNESWDGLYSSNLPEERYNHAIRYINRILEVLD